MDGASAVKRGLPQSISIFHLKNARRFEKNPNLKGRCKKAPRGTKFLPKPFMDTFRKLLLMTSSRRLGVRLLG
jgi:hypothetical protein